MKFPLPVHKYESILLKWNVEHNLSLYDDMQASKTSRSEDFKTKTKKKKGKKEKTD